MCTYLDVPWVQAHYKRPLGASSGIVSLQRFNIHLYAVYWFVRRGLQKYKQISMKMEFQKISTQYLLTMLVLAGTACSVLLQDRIQYIKDHTTMPKTTKSDLLQKLSFEDESEVADHTYGDELDYPKYENEKSDLKFVNEVSNSKNSAELYKTNEKKANGRQYGNDLKSKRENTGNVFTKRQVSGGIRNRTRCITIVVRNRRNNPDYQRCVNYLRALYGNNNDDVDVVYFSS